MSFKKVKLFHILIKILEIGHFYKYPIYYKSNDEDIYKILIKSNDQYTTEIKNIIKNNNITDIYIKIEDCEEYEFDTKNYLEKIIDKDDVKIEYKTEILHEMAANVINDLFESNLSKQKIDQANDIIRDSVNLLLTDPTATKAMLKVTSYDYYTYTHCVNVSTYALGFGAYLELNKKQMMLLGMAGILHDVGKKRIPHKIINKNGKLTDEEFNIIKSHPKHGVDILKELGETDKHLIAIVGQHHEKVDGSGYPNGLKKEQINPYAQVMAIVDIFDALTTKRSYKAAMSTFEAINIMKNQMSHELNENFLNKFIAFMSKES
ncbi:MAG: HD domain-containing protein [Arcobacteraceae bacterium]|nr:HD domain-containing protein [Arcobacteraceae bacterium]